MFVKHKTLLKNMKIGNKTEKSKKVQLQITIKAIKVINENKSKIQFKTSND